MDPGPGTDQGPRTKDQGRYNCSMSIPDGVRVLERELREICGARLQSLVIYGQRTSASHAKTESHADGHGHDNATVRTMAIVDALNVADLRACAARTAAWHEHGLATPLIVAAQEFGRSLDAFPLEFGAIIADHVVVAGPNPFETLRVDPSDIRRACEVQARSHLLHLREGFLETRGRSDALAELLLRSARPLVALLRSVTRMEDRLGTNPDAAAIVEQKVDASPGSLAQIARLVGRKDLSSDDARRLFPPYLDAVQRLTAYVDRWRSA